MTELTAEQLVGIEVLQLFGVLLAPLLALQLQKLIENYKQRKEQKLLIFKTLMATRGSRLSLEHVQALNMIPVEFYGTGKKEQLVLDAWEEYRDYLIPDAGLIKDATRSNELFLDLLDAMARYLDYNYRRVDLRRSAYVPQGHVDTELEQAKLRKAFLSLIDRGWLPVVEVSDMLAPASADLRKDTEDYLSGTAISKSNATKPELKGHPSIGPEPLQEEISSTLM